MDKMLSSAQKQLLAAISEVLHYTWDPIDVRGIPQARDEYEGYVGAIYSLVTTGATEEQISAHLASISDLRIGLPNRKDRADEAASTIVDWHDHLFSVDA